MAVHYIIHKPNGKFGTMERIGADACEYLTVYDRIDFKYPRFLKKHDKTGYRNFVFALKAFLFGNSGERMTKTKCEAFFIDDRKFA